MNRLITISFFALMPLATPTLSLANPPLESQLSHLEVELEALGVYALTASPPEHKGLRKELVEHKGEVNRIRQEILTQYPELAYELDHLQLIDAATADKLLVQARELRNHLALFEIETRRGNRDQGPSEISTLDTLLVDLDNLAKLPTLNANEVFALLNAIQRTQDQLFHILRDRFVPVSSRLSTENLRFLSIECENLVRIARELRRIVTHHRAHHPDFVTQVLAALMRLAEDRHEPEPGAFTLMLSPFVVLLP